MLYELKLADFEKEFMFFGNFCVKSCKRNTTEKSSGGFGEHLGLPQAEEERCLNVNHSVANRLYNQNCNESIVSRHPLLEYPLVTFSFEDRLLIFSGGH